MLEMFLHIKRWVLIAAVCIFTCATSGCIESEFTLEADSILPIGITLPPNLTRADVSVTVDYYTLSSAKFTLRDKTGKKLAVVKGHIKNSHPLYLAPAQGSPPGYPHYMVVVVNGETEIIGHRERRPTFYVSDDPATRREIVAGTAVEGR